MALADLARLGVVPLGEVRSRISGGLGFCAESRDPEKEILVARLCSRDESVPADEASWEGVLPATISTTRDLA